MTTHYNRLAGRNLDRLAALSDGVFAVAMTLLVLDIHVPAHDLIQDEAGLWQALIGLAPRLLTYLMSFVTLGIFWLGQQTQLNYFARADRDLVWIHIGFLARAGALWQLALRATVRAAAGRRDAGDLGGDDSADRGRANLLRGRCGVMRPRHDVEHRLHRAGAAELRRQPPMAPESPQIDDGAGAPAGAVSGPGRLPVAGQRYVVTVVLVVAGGIGAGGYALEIGAGG